MLSNLNKQNIAISIIAILHIVGSFGLLSKMYANNFAALTTLNLFICFLLIIPFKETTTKKAALFFTLSFTFGMLFEIIGVNTGFPFGEYYYSDILAPSIFGVPLIIGVNWFILSYGIISLLNTQILQMNIYLKSIFAALIMTSIDVLIEPFAIRYNLWVWGNVSVPLENYLAWFVISFCLFLLGFNILKNEKNFVAIFTVFVFVVFFALNNLLNSLLS